MSCCLNARPQSEQARWRLFRYKQAQQRKDRVIGGGRDGPDMRMVVPTAGDWRTVTLTFLRFAWAPSSPAVRARGFLRRAR
jgi:hypothetical protein